MLRIFFKNPQNLGGLVFGPLEEAVDKAMDSAAAVLFNRIRTRFRNTQAPDGTIWPESGAAKKRAETGRDGKTLFDTGTLFHSLQLSRDSVGVRSIATDVFYAPYHQEGRGQVKRVFLAWNDDDETIAVGIVKKALNKALEAA